MRLVELIDDSFELRWTWLPLWLATNPKLRGALEEELRTIIALNGLSNTEQDLDALHNHTAMRLQEMFPFVKGLREFLDGMRKLELA